MVDVIMRLPELVSDMRGRFRACAVARERPDGSWEGWLEFESADATGSPSYATSIETRQHDRVALERWASGLSRVYAEGALTRARVHEPTTPASGLLLALQEILDVLSRRLPDLEHAGEIGVAADAERLRTAATQRVNVLRRHASGPKP
jgi:hypothetical protein